MEIRIIKSNIEELKGIDAVVNSTNPSMKGYAGADKAIHKTAGHELDEECGNIGKLEVGRPITTEGYGLDYKKIIHIVAPDRSSNEAVSVMKKCFEGVLEEAVIQNMKSIAFPVIGVGHHGWTARESITIAIDTALERKNQNVCELESIYFVTPDDEIYDIALEYLIQKSNIQVHDVALTLHIHDIDGDKLTTKARSLIQNKLGKEVVGYLSDLSVLSNIAKVTTIDSVNTFIRNFIEGRLRSEGIYCRLNKLLVEVDNDQLECNLRVNAFEFTDVIHFANKKLKKSKNEYINELLPFALLTVDEVVEDSLKYKLFETIINNFPVNVLEKLASDICTSIGLDFRISNIDFKII